MNTNVTNTPENLDSQLNNLEYNTPILFDKKLKKNVIKPLTYIINDTGRTRHFTPAAQEWFNSVYSYNPNYIKSLPTADTNLMKLLKSFFNFELNHKLLNTKRIPTRLKRLSTKRVFVGRGGVKHTSSKVIITSYIYNAEKMYLNRAIKLTKNALYSPRRPLKEIVTWDRRNNKIITYNRPFSLKEYLTRPEHYNTYYTDYLVSYIDLKNLFLSNLIVQYRILSKLETMKVINKEERVNLFINLYSNIDKYNHPSFESYLESLEEYCMKKYKRYLFLLAFNNIKFKQPFMSKLINLVQKMYNKEVVFNIVNLNKLHLNSDIFTQAVTLKLKNRQNGVLRVLKSSLRKINLPESNVILDNKLKAIKDNFIVNKIRNQHISSMFNNINSNDNLNNLLLDFFPSADNILVNKKRSYTGQTPKIRSVSLLSYILNSLNHGILRGVRIEAKGRLTRRFTASRSVFKMKWIGGLKNVNSSFRGLSTIMLRGHAKSNIQYSFLNSNNRNGAFGVKGWISSK